MTTGILDADYLKTKSETGAATRTVTDDELSSNQLEKLTGKDSVMRQRAESYGKNYATSRGLLDSSIGAQAVFGAFVDRATPIAMSDAEKYSKVADQNLGYENQFKLTDKNFGQQGLLQKDSQAFTASENTLDRTWRSSENTLDRQVQREALDKELGFRQGESEKDRQLGRDEIAARERMQAAQSKADLERLGYTFQLDQMNLSASTQHQIQTMLYRQILDIQNDGNLDPASKEAAILNAMDAAKNMAASISGVQQTPIKPGTNFDAERAGNIMVAEAARMGYSNPSAAELDMALQYAKANNLTEQQMRAYVRDKLTAQPGSAGNTGQSSQSSGAGSSGAGQDLVALAAQYGYNATPEEAASVAAYAAANGLNPADVVMAELRARGMA